jgi:sodium transport system permease protein
MRLPGSPREVALVIRHARAVFRKELIDALRDRRTLLIVLLSSVLLGPLLLVALSSLFATLEAGAERREVLVAGMEHAPTLRNYIERQGIAINAAPADHERQLRENRLRDAVLVIPPDFERKLATGDMPTLEVLTDSGNRQAEAGVARVQRLVLGFARERTSLALALRGVAGPLLAPLDVEERDIAGPQARASRFTTMLPFFVILAVLYGALTAAIDTTAGERERGSLEPLLANPATPLAIVVGKWAAVVTVAALIALLSSASFVPAQWLLRSETLQVMFRYGGRELLAFGMALLPLAAAVSAALMAVAIRCRTVKEAQASAALLVLALSLVPLVTLLGTGAAEAWHLWVPGLAQNELMGRALQGEPLTARQWLVPPAVCAVLTLACLLYVARRLRDAAVKP